ncbi:MAG: 2-C-methyl-D-erythritol 4-phosphate cytidylyltransferase, partial [Ruminococcaceae bacterium]|nr:2-C-methyl-D-erythritol 4-phosphate cytidylyltransferase [Oscillospiraceae bacterium]
GGKTVLERSVEAFLEISDVDEVIVTAREQDIEQYAELLEDERITFVIGGNTRQQSVKNATDTIDDAELVLIHDGARPLIKTDDIENTIIAAKEYGAAAVGVPVKDTLKVVNANGVIVDTPDRSTLFAVQTPQVFDFKQYKKALDSASHDGKDFTDDCQLIEYIGGTVKMVTGDYSNIKITTPDDVVLCENLLLNRIRR